jgi:hypothetical protein
VFDSICRARAAETGKPFTLADHQEKIDWRNKLSCQRFPNSGFLVVYGAGGGITAAAYAPLSRFQVGRLVIDQTLYSLVVDTEAEAIYITGLFNSAAMHSLITEFVPRGAFGGRHLHKLPTTVTPAYDSSQTLHTAVASATSNLLGELDHALTESTAQRRAVRALNSTSRETQQP